MKQVTAVCRAPTVAILALAFACTALVGQGNRRTSPILPSQGGSVVMTLSPIDSIASLEDLAVQADLIVLGVVERVLPSRFHDPRTPGSIETDSLVAVQRVLYGEHGATNGRILISQMGGKSGEFTATVPQDTLLREGQEYFLFLTRETRDQMPNATGAPRYIITGVWKGKVPIDRQSGRVSFSLAPDDSPTPESTLDRLEVDEFEARAKQAALVRARVAAP